MGTRSRDSAGSGSTIAGGGRRGEPEVEGAVSAEEEARGALRIRMSGRGQARVETLADEERRI